MGSLSLIVIDIVITKIGKKNFDIDLVSIIPFLQT